jgi:ATP-binding cassette subfamily F protein 3
MPILSANNIRMVFGSRVILDSVSMAVEPGERIGIVGRNGCGKSTLMKVLCGMIRPDAGEVNLSRGARAGYLHQDPRFDEGETLRGAAESAFAELHEAHRELNLVFDRMGSASGVELERLMKRQTALESRIEQLGGYAIDHRIDAVLHGLGFSDAQFGVPVTGLSGGQRGRLALAKLLLEDPDVLLLDEPTNHLDLDGRLWLEEFLTKDFRGAVVMVSHDRYLLDHVVTRILEVEDGRLIDYPGNYEAFREIRETRRLTLLRTYENQQDRFRKEEAFIRRYRAGQRAKQARGRQTRLTREMEQSRLERPVELGTFKFNLPKAERTGDIVVAARGISKRYPTDDGGVRVLFSGLDLTISRGERWGVIGPNGSGKTTLVRCLLGELPVDEGTVRLGSGVRVGYYRQTHDHVDPDPPVWQYLQRAILRDAPSAQGSEQQARNLAGAFLFSGEEQERPMGALSGGERSRAVLAALLASARNVLVLDEPTNHLDIPSAERLEEALTPDDDGDGFEGTLLIISHDRALIDACCEHLLVFDGRGRVEVFHGNYSDWHARELERRREQTEREAEERRRRELAERQRREAEERRARSTPSDTAPRKARNPLAHLSIDDLEAGIADAEARIRQIDEQLASADVWKNPARCQELGDERQRVSAELEAMEFEWISRSEAR